MDFMELLLSAKGRDANALVQILAMYKPLLLKESIINGCFDEDLFQELCVTLLHCIERINL